LEVVEIARGCTYVHVEIEVSRGEEWSSERTDRCPLTIGFPYTNITASGIVCDDQ
jgi:hypothetical protein